MAHTILNDKRYVNLVHNGGFDVFARGTTLGGTQGPTATTTSSSTTVSALTSVVTTIRTGMTVTGASLGAAKTVSSLTSNTALVLNSSVGITTATGAATLYFGLPDVTYGPDRWYVLSQTTGVAVAQTTGDDAKNACIITNNGYQTNQRFGVAQVIPSEDTYGLRGSNVTFQVDFKSSNGLPVYAAILEWTGTADSVTKDVVSDWTKTDFSTATASGKFFAYTTLTVTGAAVVTPSASATWTSLTAQGQVSSSANNLVVFVWTQDAWTPASTLTVTQAGLYESPVVLDWYPRPIAEEAVICRRYFERIDPPTSGIIANGFSSSTTVSKATVHYMHKRSTPTSSFVGLVADVSVVDKDNTTVATACAVSLSTKMAALVSTTVASGLTSGGGNYIVDSGNATHGALEFTSDL